MLLPIHPFLDGVSSHLNFIHFTNLPIIYLLHTYMHTYIHTYLLTYLLQCPHSYTGSHPSHIKIYFHQGESLLIQCKDADLDEIAEIASRLSAVTKGCETQEMLLRRNASGQLGFHVNSEGIVTDVEPYSTAWQVGLRQSFRIVEICKVAFATLNLDEVTDLLKTSLTVSVTVLPPGFDGFPRR